MDASDDEVPDAKHFALLQKFSAPGNSVDGVRREIGSISDIIGNDSVEADAVDISKLVETSNASAATLATTLNKSNEAKRLEPQPNRFELAKAERDVDYQELSKDLKKWEPIITANRKSQNLQFPLDKEPLPYNSTSQDLTARSQARPSTLEEQIYATLKASSSSVDEKTGLTKKEEEVLNNLTSIEAEERLKALRRHRLLTSKQAARYKREKAIKSKKFKRLTTQNKMERLKERLLEKGLEETLFERRIEERASLRHKKTSRWDRKLAHYMKHDTAFRDEMQKKKQLHKKLTEKIVKTESDDEKMSVEGEDSVSEVSDNEWTVVANSKVHSKPEAYTNQEKDSDSEMEDEVLVSDPEDTNTEFLKEFKCVGETVLTGRDAGKFVPSAPSRGNDLLIDPTNFLRATQDVDLSISCKDNDMLHEAFEDDEDLFDELADSEKQKTEVENLFAGWGDWAGPDIDPNAKAIKKPQSAKTACGKKRSSRGWVVLNETKNEKLSEHQVKVRNLPFAFKKPEAFERSMRQPIGPDFNTTASFKKFVQPRVKKKVGVPIEPIAK